MGTHCQLTHPQSRRLLNQYSELGYLRVDEVPTRMIVYAQLTPRQWKGQFADNPMTSDVSRAVPAKVPQAA